MTIVEDENGKVQCFDEDFFVPERALFSAGETLRISAYRIPKDEYGLPVRFSTHILNHLCNDYTPGVTSRNCYRWYEDEFGFYSDIYDLYTMSACGDSLPTRKRHFILYDAENRNFRPWFYTLDEAVENREYWLSKGVSPERNVIVDLVGLQIVDVFSL